MRFFTSMRFSLWTNASAWVGMTRSHISMVATVAEEFVLGDLALTSAMLPRINQPP